MPSFPTAFIFTPFAEAAMYKGNLLSLVICFVPRILAGYVPSYVSDILKASNCEQVKSDMVASLFGSLTNTIFVLLLILLFFGKEYSTVLERSLLTILGTTIITNGIPEAIVCAIICPIVVKILRYI